MSAAQAQPTDPLSPLRVLVVDDSPVSRLVLLGYLGGLEGIVVVGSAPDVATARQRMEELQPDALILDLDLPTTNGLSFLESLMRRTPLPVIVVSGMVGDATHAAGLARTLGAVAVIGKAGVAEGDTARFRLELIAALALARRWRRQRPAAGP